MLFQRLGQMLAMAGYISGTQLESARLLYEAQPETDLTDLFAGQSGVSKAQISRLLEQQLGILCLEPEEGDFSPDLARMMPRQLARTYRMVPVRLRGETLYLAMADPLDLAAGEAARSVIRRKIIPVLASPAVIRQSISRLYGTDSATQAIRDLTPDKPHQPLPTTEESRSPAVRLVNSFLEFALSRQASDIHLEPREQELAVRMRIDGILHQTFSVPKSSQRSVLARIKVMANMDLAEHQLPLDGRCTFMTEHEAVDLRISTLPTVHGEKAVIRLLRRDPSLLTPTGIGLTKQQQILFQNLLTHTGGVILIAGPTGSGKSSTLYTMLDQLNTDQVNLISLEDPVEYHFAGINQVQINDRTGLGFAAALRAVLRQDPDIIALGEIRDSETADIAMRAAITGHLVLSTIHAGDASAALDRLSDMGIPPYLLAAGLRGILSQRLVRRICPHCRESYPATEAEAAFLPEGHSGILYRGKGCARCFHTGYLGRTAVFEILPINRDLQTCLCESQNRELRTSVIARSGFVPMIHHAIRLVSDGITTPDELTRILGDLSAGGSRA